MELGPETSPPPSRALPYAAGAAVALCLVAAVAAVVWFSKRDLSVMEAEPAVSRTEPPPDRLWQADNRLRGNPDAPVTLIEYSDFTCGYCLKFFKETWPRLSAKYVETGKVRFLYRDYPRDPEGPAMIAAIAARCAGDQGRYWQMHDRLFAGGLDAAPLSAHAEAIGLDRAKFDTCLRDASHRQAILRDKEDGVRLGFVGTPGFILLRTAQAGKEKPIGLPGAFPVGVFEEEIDRLLAPVVTKNKG